MSPRRTHHRLSPSLSWSIGSTNKVLRLQETRRTVRVMSPGSPKPYPTFTSLHSNMCYRLSKITYVIRGDRVSTREPLLDLRHRLGLSFLLVLITRMLITLIEGTWSLPSHHRVHGICMVETRCMTVIFETQTFSFNLRLVPFEIYNLTS